MLALDVEFDPTRCAATDADDATRSLRTRLCRIVEQSVADGEWRFDASDQMPPSIGLGSFSHGMLDYVDQGPSSIDRILQDIDSSWRT